MGKSKTCKFFMVEDKCNPIIGLSDSIALQLLSVNVPFTDKWTGNVHSKSLILGMMRWRLKMLVNR